MLHVCKNGCKRPGIKSCLFVLSDVAFYLFFPVSCCLQLSGGVGLGGNYME